MKQRAAVGAIAGGVQKMLTRATHTLIYELCIASTVVKPRISAGPDSVPQQFSREFIQ